MADPKPKYRYRATKSDMPGTPLKQRIENAYPKTTLEQRIGKPKAETVAPKKPMWKSYGKVPVGGPGGKAKLLQAGGKF